MFKHFLVTSLLCDSVRSRPHNDSKLWRWVRNHVVGPGQTPERGVVVGMTGPKRVDHDLPKKGELVAGPQTENGKATIAGVLGVGTSAMALHRAAVVFSRGTAPDPRATLEATGGEDQSASGTSQGVVHQGILHYIFCYHHVLLFVSNLSHVRLPKELCLTCFRSFFLRLNQMKCLLTMFNICQ